MERRGILMAMALLTAWASVLAFALAGPRPATSSPFAPSVPWWRLPAVRRAG